MRCSVLYRHPVTGNYYYFCDFRNDGKELKPVGCFRCFRHKKATVFQTKKDATKIVKYLRSIGYSYVRIV